MSKDKPEDYDDSNEDRQVYLSAWLQYRRTRCISAEVWTEPAFGDGPSSCNWDLEQAREVHAWLGRAIDWMENKPEDYEGVCTSMVVTSDVIGVSIRDGSLYGKVYVRWSIDDARKVCNWLNESIGWMGEAASNTKPGDHSGVSEYMEVTPNLIKVDIADDSSPCMSNVHWTTAKAREIHAWLNGAIEWLEGRQ